MSGQQHLLNIVPTADDNPPQLQQSFECSLQLQLQLAVLSLEEKHCPVALLLSALGSIC